MSAHSGVRVGSFRLAVALLLAGVAFFAIPPTPADAASPCRVRNLDDGTSWTSLVSAVAAARPGDRITLRGTCAGPVIIRKRLEIRGVRTATSGRAVLDGRQLGSVIAIRDSARVTISDLTIRGGLARRGGGLIIGRGTVVLRDVVVRDCRARLGGGIYVDKEGRLTLSGATRVTSDYATYKGGGIHNGGQLRIEDDSTIARNEGEWGAGIFTRAGRVVVRGSSVVRDNFGAVFGGGIGIRRGSLVIGGSASVSGNGAGMGGGLWVLGGEVTIRYAGVISGNHGMDGGGVANEGGSVTLTGTASIRGNRAWFGAGVYDLAGLTVAGSSAIRDNEATQRGGGVAIYGGRVTMVGSGTIHDNAAGDTGGGIYSEDATLVDVRCDPEPDANVYANQPDDCVSRPSGSTLRS